MIRTVLAATLLASTAIAAPASAEETAAAPAAAKFSTAGSTIGDLVDNPKAKSVLDKHFPKMSENPQMAMARGMTIRDIQQFAPDIFTDEKLAEVDADLAKIEG